MYYYAKIRSSSSISAFIDTRRRIRVPHHLVRFVERFVQRRSHHLPRDVLHRSHHLPSHAFCRRGTPIEAHEVAQSRGAVEQKHLIYIRHLGALLVKAICWMREAETETAAAVALAGALAVAVAVADTCAAGPAGRLGVSSLTKPTDVADAACEHSRGHPVTEVRFFSNAISGAAFANVGESAERWKSDVCVAWMSVVLSQKLDAVVMCEHHETCDVKGCR